ncbi:MAG TPA: hypothetical protein VGL98_15430 [Gammaproteobacteria bacterium]
MLTVDAILTAAGLLHASEKKWAAGNHVVYLSPANQLLGSYSALERYRSHESRHYGSRGREPAWEAHHIFETRELDYLGVQAKFPDRAQCLCVLIPKPAHIRINTVFAGHTRQFKDIQGILQGYRLAHSILGNYSGAPPGAVATELDQIIRAAFRSAGLSV